MKLRKFYKNIVRPLRRHCDKTAAIYKNSIGLLSRFVERPAKLKDLNSVTVSQFVEWRDDQVGSRHTLEKDISPIKFMWKFGAGKTNPKTGSRYVSEAPEIPRIVKPQIEPVAYTNDELSSLIESCKKFTGHKYCGIPSNLWWHGLHLVILETGERIGAVRQVRFSDLNGSVITFRAETRKGGVKPNIKELSGQTIGVLSEIRKHNSGLMFPWDRSDGLLYQHYRAIRDDAGLLVSGHAFHKLRKTLATLIAMAGGNAQDALCHSSAATTQKHYLDRRFTSEIDFHKYVPLKVAI